MFRKVTYRFPAFTSTYESKKVRKHTVLFATYIVGKEGVKKFGSLLTLFYNRECMVMRIVRYNTFLLWP